MFINLIDVKINNTYDYKVSAAPTVAEKAPDYSAGQTWLDLTTGYSYILTDETLGTWVRIEIAEDNQTDFIGDNAVKNIMKDLNNNFIADRNGSYYDLSVGIPSYSFFGRDALYKLVNTESLFSSWDFDSATKTITSAGIYGDITAFSVGDLICIETSRKNKGFFTIAAVGDDYITVNETIKEETGFAFVSLVVIPEEFTQLTGRMIWYDVFKRPSLSSGMSSERIGNYSYTMQAITSGGYPSGIAAGLESYRLMAISTGENYVY